MTEYPEYITVVQDCARVDIVLSHLHELDAPAWGAVCRMLIRDCRNDATTRFLREYFPAALKAATVEDREKGYAAVREKKDLRKIKDPRMKEAQKRRNATLDREAKDASRKLKRLIEHSEKFDKMTKGVE